MGKPRIRVERDRSTDDQWTVTEYSRRGWSVLFRGDRSDAHRYAQSAVNADRTIASEMDY